MRYLGIDFGTKRIGVALSDDDGTMAFPHGIVPNNDQAVAAVARIAKENVVGAIVMGESVNYKGTPNEIAPAIARFAEALRQKTGLPMEFEKETMTSLAAARIQGEHEKLDASAAALILTSYLDRHRSV